MYHVGNIGQCKFATKKFGFKGVPTIHSVAIRKEVASESRRYNRIVPNFCLLM